MRILKVEVQPLLLSAFIYGHSHHAQLPAIQSSTDCSLHAAKRLHWQRDLATVVASVGCELFCGLLFDSFEVKQNVSRHQLSNRTNRVGLWRNPCGS